MSRLLLSEIDVRTATVDEIERAVKLAQAEIEAWVRAVRKRIEELKAEAP